MYLMDSDFRPVKGPAKSLQSNLDDLKKTAADTNNFKTPEQMAATDAIADVPETSVPQIPPARPAEPASKHGLKQRLADFWPPNKKEWAAIAFFVIALGMAITVT